jgi:UDP-glucose:(heptosyl)LPS alpha-1,3-glucosyltransferase
VRADLIESFALDPAKVVTLYNGVDLERFRAPGDAAARAVMRSELGIPKGARAIVFVGNGFARKGLPFMIEAWPALDGAPWLIVAGADRAMGAYRRRANRLGVGSRIIFAGPHSRVERLFAAADGLALPSLFEPFGNVVMEAMAAGLPVLCGAACGAAETLPAPMREFIVRDPANLDELASRLNALLRAGGELCHVARATAEKFTWERYGAQLLALIDSL